MEPTLRSELEAALNARDVSAYGVIKGKGVSFEDMCREFPDRVMAIHHLHTGWCEMKDRAALEAADAEDRAHRTEAYKLTQLAQGLEWLMPWPFTLEQTESGFWGAVGLSVMRAESAALMARAALFGTMAEPEKTRAIEQHAADSAAALERWQANPAAFAQLQGELQHLPA